MINNKVPNASRNRRWSLAHIREVDAIAHVVRCFVDDNVSHVEARIDPANDIEVIDTELLLADLESVERAIARVDKVAKSGDKDQATQQRPVEIEALQ